jgi:hypothetical protein
MDQHHQSLQYLSPTATTGCITLTTGDRNKLQKHHPTYKGNSKIKSNFIISFDKRVAQ